MKLFKNQEGFSDVITVAILAGVIGSIFMAGVFVWGEVDKTNSINNLYSKLSKVVKINEEVGENKEVEKKIDNASFSSLELFDNNGNLIRTMYFPDEYELINGRVGRRGSFNAFRFAGGTAYGSFNELQLFSKESIKKFDDVCQKAEERGEAPCFFGDYHTLEDYLGMLEAFKKQEDYDKYKLIKFNGISYFVDTYKVTGDEGYIRQYTTFFDDIQADLWISMLDISDVELADNLMKSIKFVKKDNPQKQDKVEGQTNQTSISSNEWEDLLRYNCELSGGSFSDHNCECPIEEDIGQTQEMMYDKSTGYCQTTYGGPGGDAFASSVGLPFGNYNFWTSIVGNNCKETGGVWSIARCICSDQMTYDESTGYCK